MFSEPSDIFRQFIWIPDTGLSEAEYLEFVHAIGNSNKAINRFLAGEVTEDEFLDLVRSPLLLDIDEYIATVEHNLDMVERGVLIL